MVEDLIANLICCSSELLCTHLRRIIAVVLRCQRRHLSRHLSSPVSCGAAEALERHKACCSGSRLPSWLVRASILAVLLLTVSPEHRVQHLGVIAVGLHLHFGLHSWLVADGMAASVDVLRTLRVMILILIHVIQVQILLIIHGHIVHRAVSTLDQRRLLRHRQPTWWMLVLIRKMNILLSEHE